MAFGPGGSPDHPGEAVGPRLQATWRASRRPDPAIFPHRVPAASRTSRTSSQPLALAAENKNSQVPTPRGPRWRGGCSGMSLSADKFNYRPAARLKFLLLKHHPPEHPKVPSDQVCGSQGEGVKNGKMVTGPGDFGVIPGGESRPVCFLPPCPPSLLEIPQPQEWAKSGSEWQRRRSPTQRL